MSITLSVVIPNYNGSAFLLASLRSVFSQITSNCEVVLVDDGSSDHSVDLVRQNFADELEGGQFILICTENGGIGAARNIGVQAARGSYIAFLDSDDFILPGYIARILSVLSDSVPDIVQFNLLRVLDDDLRGQQLIVCHTSPDGRYEMDAVRDEIFGLGKWFAPSRIFAREIILANPFPAERVFYEDLQLLPFVFLQDLAIFLISDPLIAYRDNPRGATRNHKPEHAQTMLALFSRLSSLPRSVPRDLLRVQVARSIVFFVLELKLRKINLWGLLHQVRTVENKPSLATYLGRADRFFLRFPLIYTFIDWGRKKFHYLRSRI